MNRTTSPPPFYALTPEWELGSEESSRRPSEAARQCREHWVDLANRLRAAPLAGEAFEPEHAVKRRPPTLSTLVVRIRIPRLRARPRLELLPGRLLGLP
ncbi:MAG: hypothetical protein ACT4QD_24965 [Acidobacteriota bacterium]